MVDKDKGNLGAKVFYIWGSLCATAFVYTWFLIPETKGLTLEQVDKMLEETTPRTSAKWIPHDTYAVDMGFAGAPSQKPLDEDVDGYGNEARNRDGEEDMGGESENPFLRVL